MNGKSEIIDELSLGIAQLLDEAEGELADATTLGSALFIKKHAEILYSLANGRTFLEVIDGPAPVALPERIVKKIAAPIKPTPVTKKKLPVKKKTVSKKSTKKKKGSRK